MCINSVSTGMHSSEKAEEERKMQKNVENWKRN